MFDLPRLKKKANARTQIAINGVENGVLKLPNHQYRAVLKVSSLNFELKSEDEQDAIIDTYESFLNSVGGNLQILIRTREVDMDKYLEDITARSDMEKETVYKQQLKNYDEFIRSLISTNKILTRHFYIIVPYTGLKKIDFDVVQEQLKLKLDIIAKGMMRLGMQTSQLSSLEVLELFYSFYNPLQSKLQPLTDQTLQLIHTALVEKEASHA